MLRMKGVTRTSEVFVLMSLTTTQDKYTLALPPPIPEALALSPGQFHSPPLKK